MKETGYLDHLVAIHFNDSKVPWGSRKDRHEKIGKGEIGAEALTLFLQAKEFEGLPIVLETPVEDESEYADEIQFLHRLKNGKE
jgi:deoxyribonuclease-4